MGDFGLTTSPLHKQTSAVLRRLRAQIGRNGPSGSVADEKAAEIDAILEKRFENVAGGSA